MSWWKQSILALVVLLAGATLWALYYPGAPEMMARSGFGWVPFATVQSDAPDRSGNAAPNHGPSGAMRPLVVAEQAGSSTINDRATAIGTGRAVSSVAVTPFASGRLAEVLTTSGSTVTRGEVIARLDADGEEIAVDRARIALDDAESRLERVSALVSSNTISAVQRAEADLAARNAALALRDAELALDRRSIRSPIDGIVGIINVNEGNYITSQTELVTIDDRSQILVDFAVPERFAGLIEVGGPISAASVARPDQVFAGEISAVDNRIDATSRTLRVQARITNPGDRLRAGMAFRVEIRFPGDTFPAVNPLAIQWGTDGAFIWVVREGLGQRTPIRIIQRNTDSVLVDADIQEGTMVVTEGVHAVRDGSPITIIGDSPGDAVSRAQSSASGT